MRSPLVLLAALHLVAAGPSLTPRQNDRSSSQVPSPRLSERNGGNALSLFKRQLECSTPGWILCDSTSAGGDTTCHPPGTPCCDNGASFCLAGYYCVTGGGCCPLGQVCTGPNPGTSTIEDGPIPTGANNGHSGAHTGGVLPGPVLPAAVAAVAGLLGALA